jgi:hypothetical protein
MQSEAASAQKIIFSKQKRETDSLVVSSEMMLAVRFQIL